VYLRAEYQACSPIHGPQSHRQTPPSRTTVPHLRDYPRLRHVFRLYPQPQHPHRKTSRVLSATRPSSQSRTGSRMKRNSTSSDSHGAAQTANRYFTLENASGSTTRNYMYGVPSILPILFTDDQQGCEHCKQPRESGQPTSRKASPCVKKYEIVMHDKDAWGCGFCSCLLTTWEERCEHIAMHEEKGNSKWNFTNVVLGLLKQSEVAHAWSQLLLQRHGEEQNWPTLAWESKRCNRLRYKLETKWDTRAFDLEKLVQDTYDLAEIEAKDVLLEAAPETTPELPEPTDSSQGEIVEFKLETSDFGADHRLQSSHGLPPDHTMMDLDPIEPPQAMHHQAMQQTQWPVSTDMGQNNMVGATSMGAFGGFDTHMSTMPGDFSQPVTQGFQQQQTWPNAGFVSTPDLINYQQPTPYMNYNQQREMVSVPTSQYANLAHYPPRQSLPPNFLHQQPHASTPSSRRYVPKLINISNSSRIPQHEQPPPPPPKDDNPQHNRFSRMIMRRRPSNISQHSLVSQRDVGWMNDDNWG
jgi:hypothetical protein